MATNSSGAALSTLALLCAALLATAAGCDSAAPMDDAGPSIPDAAGGCPDPDGTPLGDCMAYSCLVNGFSRTYCTSGLVYNFNCEGIDSFPPAYLDTIQTYFSDCGAAISSIEDTEVPVMGGTYLATRCEILGCAIQPNSARLFMGMAGVMRAECAPVPAPACDFPDPPAP